MNTLGMRLRAARGARTQREIAEASGLSIAYISDLESGKLENPTLAALGRLATALTVEPGSLMSPGQPYTRHMWAVEVAERYRDGVLGFNRVENPGASEDAQQAWATIAYHLAYSIAMNNGNLHEYDVEEDVEGLLSQVVLTGDLPKAGIAGISNEGAGLSPRQKREVAEAIDASMAASRNREER